MIQSTSNVAVKASQAKRPRRLWKWLAGLAVVFAAVLLGAGWYLTSDHFHEWARARLIAELEQITGGRVEVGKFAWNLSRLQIEVSDLTIHGLEGPGEIPYFHADRFLVQARITSILHRDIVLNRVAIASPTVHLLVYPDGHTNQPRPKTGNASTSAQDIFDLNIKHAEVTSGQFLLNDEKLPFDFNANDLQAGMKRAAHEERYDGTLSVSVEQIHFGSIRQDNLGAKVSFALRPNEFDLNSFATSLGKSKLEANGKLTDFTNPQVKLNYTASIDVADLAGVLRLRELRRGDMTLGGSATYAAARWTTAGKLVVRDLDYVTPGLRLAHTDAAADYYADKDKLSATHIVARVLRGIAKGDLNIAWAAPLARGKGAEQFGSLKLNVSGVPANMLAEAFSTRDLDLKQLRAVGTGSGSVELRWRGDPSRTVVDIDATVTPPEMTAPGELPVTGDLKGAYDTRSEQLQADSLHLTLPMLRLEGSGTIGSTHEGLHLATTVTDLTELQPLLAMVREQDASVGRLAGQLSFVGELSGKLGDPSINGHLQLSDFTFPLAAIWTPPPPVEVVSEAVPRQTKPKFIHIDSGAANIAYSPHGVLVRDGVVKRGTAQAELEFSMGLTDHAFTDSSPVSLKLAIHDADFAELQQIAGYNYPVTGKLAADVQVHGTRLDLQGGGRVQLKDGSAYGQSIRSTSADMRFANDEVQVNNFVLSHEHAQVAGSGAYSFKSETFRLQAVGSNFELATVPQLNRKYLSVAGQLSFSASGSGTLGAPVVNASANLHNLVINGQRVGDGRLLAVTKGDTTQLSARSNFKAAELMMSGEVRLRGDFPANITVQLRDFDFIPFLNSALQTPLKGQSYIGATLTVAGPLKTPAALTVNAEIPQLRAEMQGLEMHNAEPIRVSITNQRLRLDSFNLVGSDTQFTAAGSVNLSGDRRMSLRGDGRLNLKLAQSLDPDINSSGFVDAHINVRGTVSNPSLVGEVKLTNGAVSLIDFPNGLSDINGTLVFNEERIQVQTLTARTGGGDIRIGGFATYDPSVAFNVTVQGSDIRMRYPQGVSTSGNLDLKLVGTLNSSTLSGDITITRFAFNEQFNLGSYLAKSVAGPPVPTTSPLNNVHFNLHVVSIPQLQVQSSLAKVAGTADLKVRGTPVTPVLLGHINITEGQIDFNGASYRIDRGDVSFVNPAHTEPTIDVAATTRVRDYDITLRFSGQPSRGLKTNYSSDPPLPAADIINLLAFGQTREQAQIEATNGSNTMTETVSNAILGQAINNAVSNRMQKLFGVSRVKISPELGGAQTNPTAQLTVEQQVSDKVTVTYISNLTQSSQQSIFVEYYINRNISVIGGRDQYGVVSIDVRVRQRKR
ncbi:MAG TPA: translocation/assembly module TamB domain-containing protein [Terriglobales bacterium]|nr:translocation/assembly module TamB domain-containing protein [Terriglobales bacterium]